MRKNNYSLWEKEFLEFMDTTPHEPPPRLSANLMMKLTKYQRVLKWLIFLKFGSIQGGFAMLTLFLCPQFEVGFTSYDHLAALVEHHHGIGFMVACGAFFLSGGVLLGTVFLTVHEMKIIGKSEWIYFPAASLIALLAFFLVGAELNLAEVLPWFIGGTSGSILCFEITRMISIQLRSGSA